MNHVSALFPESLKSKLRGSLIEVIYDKYRFYSTTPESVSVSTPLGDVEFFIHEGDSLKNYIQRNGSYEPHLTSTLADRLSKEDVFFDVGSRFGYYTQLALLAGVNDENIYGFEAKPLYRYILSQCTHSQDSIHIYSGRVGDQVSDIRLDDISASPTVVKMDIEGGELSALQGAQKMLEQDQPEIYVEVHPQYLPIGGAAQVRSLLSGCGYDLQVIDHRNSDEDWIPVDRADLDSRDQEYLLRAIP